MQTGFNGSCSALRRDDRGAVAIIFSFLAITLMLVVGLAIDGGRAFHANSKIGAVIDAAALAAAKGMRESNLSDAEVRTLAQTFFDENMKGFGSGFINITSYEVTIDRGKSSVAINVSSDVTTTFGALAGISEISMVNSTIAKFESKDIELALSLDVTGSMCSPCSKIADLKVATKDLLDILMPDAGTSNMIRVGFAPFAAGINAASYAAPASGGRSPDGCVYERQGANKTGDQAPGGSAYMQVAGDPGITSTLNKCPGSARIVALSDDKDLLKNEVDTFATGGSTAGHLGTAWAWYLVSPNWSSVWPGASEPVAYGDDETIKAVILMTDGKYNTYGGNYGGGTNRDKSENDAMALCSNMKAREVIVYTVGFKLNDPRAINVLQNCANSIVHFFQAENGAQLRAAFRAIATDLNSLRLTK